MYDHFEDGESWQLFDPRPMRRTAPYTFFVPSEAELAAVRAGDLLQLGAVPEGLDDAAPERLWVRIGTLGATWDGVIESGGVPGMEAGTCLQFAPWRVLAVSEVRVDDLEEEARFLAQAQVDLRILQGDVGISRLERRAPHPVPGPWADTGWHFYGPGEGAPLHAGPIGLVLNIDDSMMPLLRAPVGARIERFADGWRRVA